MHNNNNNNNDNNNNNNIEMFIQGTSCTHLEVLLSLLLLKDIS